MEIETVIFGTGVCHFWHPDLLVMSGEKNYTVIMKNKLNKKERTP